MSSGSSSVERVESLTGAQQNRALKPSISRLPTLNFPQPAKSAKSAMLVLYLAYAKPASSFVLLLSIGSCSGTYTVHNSHKSCNMKACESGSTTFLYMSLHLYRKGFFIVVVVVAAVVVAVAVAVVFVM